MNDAIKTSKFLSLVLRHNPSLIGIVLDKNGWVDVEELLEKLKSKSLYLTFDELKEIVESNNKKRFALSIDSKKIRANQGHSISVELDYKEQTPPDFLYHGTSEKNVDSIFMNGISKMNRHHVHLSQDITTAHQVGKRHGTPVILKINSGNMKKAGFSFFLSDNNVWLTDFIPMEFITSNNLD